MHAPQDPCKSINKHPAIEKSLNLHFIMGATSIPQQAEFHLVGMYALYKDQRLAGLLRKVHLY